MKNMQLLLVAIIASNGSLAYAGEAGDRLLEQENALSEMRFMKDKYELQAAMSKSLKDMADSGFIVDENGVPMGVGDMEKLAYEVRLQGGSRSEEEFNPNDPFGGMSPVIPMPAPTRSSAAKAEQEEDNDTDDDVVVVSKPSDQEKAQGKQVLALTEIKQDSAVLFTNNGFELVHVGETVYDMRLTSLGIDNVVLEGPDGRRLLRIDWTKSVRYSDD